MSDAIEVLKKRIIPEYEDKLDLAFQCEEKEAKEELQSLKKALLALEQKDNDRKQGALEELKNLLIIEDKIKVSWVLMKSRIKNRIKELEEGSVKE